MPLYKYEPTIPALTRVPTEITFPSPPTSMKPKRRRTKLSQRPTDLLHSDFQNPTPQALAKVRHAVGVPFGNPFDLLGLDLESDIVVDGRALLVSKAVNRSEAGKLKEAHAKNKKARDPRNLALAAESSPHSLHGPT